MYLGYETSGRLNMTLKDDDANKREYSLELINGDQRQESNKVNIGRNGKGRYWTMRITNTLGCDFSVDSIAVLPVLLNRKPSR